jgi:multidrug efflux pump subunit AcrA (membrane-fusion protein)
MRPPHLSAAGLAAVACLAALPSCRSASGGAGGDTTEPGLARVARRAVEDVFLMTGELRAVRSVSVVAPRSEGPLQIRWMAEDGADVAAGERVLELDASRVIQNIEERRLRLRQAENERESRERTLAAEGDRKRVAVDKAEVESEKARVDAEVPAELRSALEWRKMQAALLEKKAALEKARLELKAFETSSRSDLEVLRRSEEKIRREVDAAEKSLASLSVRAPKSGVFLVSNFWQWGPEGPRKLQPGDTVWPGYGVASIPDPSAMEVAATLSEVDHGQVAAGMDVRCILDTYPDRTFTGRIEEVRAVAAEPRRLAGGATTVSGFPVRISLATTDPVMRPGMSVRVEVVRRRWPGALALPRAAVRFEDARAAVVRQGDADPTPVRVAACTPVECVLEGGLEEGDDVVLP